MQKNERIKPFKFLVVESTLEPLTEADRDKIAKYNDQVNAKEWYLFKAKGNQEQEHQVNAIFNYCKKHNLLYTDILGEPSYTGEAWLEYCKGLNISVEIIKDNKELIESIDLYE